MLGRSARGTGEGGGHHDGGGLRGPTHGAGHVVVVMTANPFILTTVEVAVCARHKRCVWSNTDSWCRFLSGSIASLRQPLYNSTQEEGHVFVQCQPSWVASVCIISDHAKFVSEETLAGTAIPCGRGYGKRGGGGAYLALNFHVTRPIPL